MYAQNNQNNQEFYFDKITNKKGIDVSSYQGDIDWKAVKDSGVEFAMIRVGYRGYGTGTLRYDTKYKQNIEGALSNGIDCGVYFFTQAINEAEAIEEANYVVNGIQGYNITYPIVIDTEYVTSDKTGRADNLSVSDRTNICKAFCSRISDCGYKPMIYASKYWIYDNINISELSNYLVWLAHYVKGAPENKSDYKGDYLIWQYTSTGSVNGINGDVDLDILYK